MSLPLIVESLVSILAMDFEEHELENGTMELARGDGNTIYIRMRDTDDVPVVLNSDNWATDVKWRTITTSSIIHQARSFILSMESEDRRPYYRVLVKTMLRAIKCLKDIFTDEDVTHKFHQIFINYCVMREILFNTPLPTETVNTNPTDSQPVMGFDGDVWQFNTPLPTETVNPNTHPTDPQPPA